MVGVTELAPRELETLQLLSEGNSTHEAAAIRHVSVETVKAQVRTILWKLDARNRTHAVAKALRQGLIT